MQLLCSIMTITQVGIRILGRVSSAVLLSPSRLLLLLPPSACGRLSFVSSDPTNSHRRKAQASSFVARPSGRSTF
ncbi:hypothetical protein GGR53DRAFT_496378 [Hypoxylon sp. FL1150]|nr:hypothetical protein GGR53DRAFT_496378 [Hypoxylon sp. FL1150]